jgi:glucan phosphorylase
MERHPDEPIAARLARIEERLLNTPTKAEMLQAIDSLRVELMQRMDFTQAENNRRFDTVETELKAMQKQIHQLYIFIIGTALATLMAGLGALAALPILR